ncbi:hypothetical protein HF086_010780 [Spodoptera exigua]|uniref:WH1 domain-containing protein n=1 Tax=Spodoptera exigua TaxID=7107 RepID=A0A922M097_SPOEX|nr:hypothetical protein HF086_010780 [Spodoptera exigua]
MGNKLSSCSCAPILRKAYRYEDSPWQNSRRRDGHLLRLWAEVFHVSASGAGTVKWQQVSEDLVPVNITCIQDSPECVFHITAYNSQVDKILDVRLLQPGTRIGQASECFVYWKDPMTNDTWGLNFTSPIDAKQFRECCSPSFKFSRKASSSYSLKLEPPGNKQKFKAKRKPLSTPASPNRSSLTYGREPQCTCMTQEQYARLRAQDPRYRSSTLPRTTTRAIETDAGATGTAGRSDKVAAATSSTSLYDNVSNSQPAHQPPPKPASRQTDTQPPTRPPKSQETSTMTTNTSTAPKTVTASVGTHGTNTNEETQAGGGGASTQHSQDLKSEGVQAGGTLTSSKSSATSTRSGKEHLQHMPKSVDYGDGNESSRESDRHAAHHHNVINNNTSGSRRTKSKSTEDMNMDSSTLKRMLKPMPSTESPVTSPEMGRRRYGGTAPCPPSCGSHGHRHQQHMHHGHYSHIVNNNSRQSSQRRGVGVGAAPSGYPGRGLYLELGSGERDMSPPSDNVMFDNQCYATTPSSSNGNSDQEPCQRRDSRQHHHGKPCLSRQASQSSATPAPGSPTSRLLLEYEMHLRNTLAKGMDAESYSLHTFEALLSQSMEDLGFKALKHVFHSNIYSYLAEYNDNVSSSNQRSPYPPRRRPTQESILQSLRHLKEAALRDRAASQCSGGGSRSSTLPLPHRLGVERQHSARSDRDGYYSDRNELMRERERDRERGYLSDHNSRDRVRDRDQGYLSDHQSRSVL